MRLSEYQRPGQNNFGFIRVVAAIAVVYSHAFLVTKGSTVLEPLDFTTSYPLGAHAVNAFFILSGLMVAGSLDRAPGILAFAGARLLRIVPALIVVVIACFGFAVLYLLLAGLALPSWFDTANYFIRNALFLGAGATLPGIFENNAVPFELNPPLWTLKFEIFFYATLAGIAALLRAFGVNWRGPSRYFDGMVLLILVASAAYLVFGFVHYHAHGQGHHFARFAFGFFLGVLAWRYRQLVVVNLGTVLLFLTIAVLLTIADERLAQVSQITFLAVLVFWIGQFRMPVVSDFVDRQDYSYGIYITGYPLQQLGVALFPGQSPLANVFFTLPLALLAACFLWNVIEYPALRLKHRLSHLALGLVRSS